MDVFLGARDLGEGLTLPYVWNAIHLSAQLVATLETKGGALVESDRINKSDAFLYHSLQHVDAQDWKAFCAAAGWTAYGAVALSWCSGAEIQSVWDALDASGLAPSPDPGFDRLAQFLNPEILPEGSTLSELRGQSGGRQIAFCALIAACRAPLVWDLPEDTLCNAPPEIVAFLLPRLAALADRTGEQEGVLRVWEGSARRMPLSA